MDNSNLSILGTAKLVNVEVDLPTRLRIAEQVLFKILEELFQLADNDLEKCDSRTSALIMSVASIIKVGKLIQLIRSIPFRFY